MLFSKESCRSYLSRENLIYILILPVVLFTFFCTALGPHPLFTHFYRLPCLLFFAVAIFRNRHRKLGKVLALPLLMTVWFVFLQLRQGSEAFSIFPFPSFFCVYLFAFPLAFLMKDGDKKACLTLFSLSFLAATLCMAGVALLLVLDRLPPMLAEHAYWDGARLHPFWHSNMAACLLMLGVASSLGFLQKVSSPWMKLALAAAILLQLATMALTNCRTAILLTGGLLGGTAFFRILKGNWKRFLPGCIVACGIIILVFTGSSRLFQAHSEALTQKYVAQYQQGLATEDSPIAYVDPTTGEIILKTDSAQGSLIEDLTSFNSRTTIWASTFQALREDPETLVFGCPSPGAYISHHLRWTVFHGHNAWVECLLGLGIPGFMMALAFTLLALWNSLTVLLKYPMDVCKRTVALLVLCLLAAALMEPYLFLTMADYHIFNFVFFLCTGYLVQWQKADDRTLRQVLRTASK